VVRHVLVWLVALGTTASASAQGLFGYPLEKPGLQPGVRAVATWTNNVTHASRGGDSDVVLEVSPYINAQSSAPRASYQLSYQLRNFVRLGEGDFNFFRHALNGRGSFALVDDRFGVDLFGFMGTINASAAGPISDDPASSFTNTANVRYFTVSPWYRDTLGRIARYELRYSLAHSGSSRDFQTAKLSHEASALVDGIQGASKWNWRWAGEVQQREFDNGITLERRHSSGTLYYSIYPSLRVYGMIDFDQIDGLRNEDGDNHGYGPGAGFDWAPFERTSVSGSVSRRYYGTVGNFNVSHTMHRATMGLSWARSVLTSANASLLQFDPFSLTSGFGLNQPFNQPNSIVSNLLASGIVLPPGTVFTQGMFTDAAVLDRRMTAFWGLRGARNSFTVTGFFSTRESTTELQSTTELSGIRGSVVVGGVFVGEIRERGLVTSFARRLDGRSTVDVTLDRRRIESPATLLNADFTTLRLGYITWITSDMTAFGGVRRTLQSGEGRTSSYNENAIYGGIDLRFH